MKTDRPLFWIVLVLLSLGSLVGAYRYFGEAFPLISLDLQMDRATALQRARELAVRNQWGPPEYEQAASFGSSSRVQNFIELEGGGKEAFTRVMAGDLYSAYTWGVRHFREKEATETLVRFTPAGKLWGFREQLPEDQPGATLSDEEARSLAETRLKEILGIELGPYELVEHAQEVQPGGRTDHRLVYEHRRQDIGDARYRLRLTVSGDRFTEIARFIKVPESFDRRYQEMRSSNTTIGIIGGVAMVLVYILGGCLIGLFFLLRRGWVLWKQALFWGLLVALLQGLVALNQLPLAWMNYDTALSRQGFLADQIVGALVQFVVLGIVLTLSFMAAETLSRKAFPHHIQLWKLGSRSVANTRPVLGYTVAGYLLVPLFFGYEVALYFFSNNVLGWWSPSNALLEPDVLATYLPWLSSIAISLQAGFWEECLFRAVPLAGAALLGRRFGKPALWIGAAMVLQALIFGAGHAAYPTQPAYARVVELILPSLFFGAIYLRYGLLSAIVLHFAFDVVWFAIPLFVSEAPGVWVDQVLVVLLTLAPLGAIGWVRWRSGEWSALSPDKLNGAWSPPSPRESEVEAEALPVESVSVLSPALRSGLLLGGIAGLAIWVLLGKFQTDVPQLTVDREQAVKIAREALEEKGVRIPPSWREMVSVRGGATRTGRFVWQTAGPETHEKLIGSYVPGARWRIRHATFEGSVEERAEEYRVIVSDSDSVPRVIHRLPEAREGAALSEEEARSKAQAAVSGRFGLAPEDIEEVSAEPSQRPARRDWTFVFADRTQSLPRGEARVAAVVAGDEVSDVYRLVHLPEDWERDERSRSSLVRILGIVSSILLALGALAAAVVAVVSWSRRKFSARTFFWLASILFLLRLTIFLNRWPALTSDLTTAAPLSHQILALIAGSLIGILFLSLLLALLFGWVKASGCWGDEPTGGKIALGVAMGVAAKALEVLATAFAAAKAPAWPQFRVMDDYLPAIGPLMESIVQYLTLLCVLLVAVSLVEVLTRGWSRRRYAGGLLILVGLAVQGADVDGVGEWLLKGMLLGALLLAAYIYLRAEAGLIPLALASYLALGLLQQAVDQPYGGALLHYGLAAAGPLVAGWLFWKHLGGPVNENVTRTPPSEQQA